MELNVLDNEMWFVQEVNFRQAATTSFSAYKVDVEALAGQFLGHNSHPASKKPDSSQSRSDSTGESSSTQHRLLE
jgi:hypothetical protein